MLRANFTEKKESHFTAADIIQHIPLPFHLYGKHYFFKSQQSGQ